MGEEQKSITLRLKALHCPMNWTFQRDPLKPSAAHMVESIELKLSETEEEGVFKWHKFVLTVLLCNEYYNMENYDKAMEAQKECETIINMPDSKGYYEKFYHDTKEALLHVLLSCKCHILLASGDIASLEGMLEEIPKYEDMNTQSKAALLGMQSSFSMEYGHEGNKIGLKYIEQALELNPNEGEWQFLLGRCLGRLRQVEDFTSMPSDRELKALDLAYAITGNPSYLCFMATAYRQAARHVQYTSTTFLDEMFEKSSSLYRAALEKTGNCSHVLSRCAFGFWKLPPPYQDPELAKECYKRALKMAPKNVMANHIAGIISECCDRDYEKAKEYYEKAAEGGAYGAFMNLQKLRFNEEEGYDPLLDLEFLLKKFPQEPRCSQTKMHIGSAYLFINDDLSSALDYWMGIIEERPEDEGLKRFKSNFIITKEPMNIYKIIINETRLALKENKASAEDKLKFQQAYQKCIDKQPDLNDLLLSPPQSWKEKFCVAKRRSDSLHPRHGRGNARGFGRSESHNSSDSFHPRRGRGNARGFGRSESHNSSHNNGTHGANNSWRERGRGRSLSNSRNMENKYDSTQKNDTKENFKSNWRSSAENGSLNNIKNRESNIDSDQNSDANENHYGHHRRTSTGRGVLSNGRGRGYTTENTGVKKNDDTNWRLR